MTPTPPNMPTAEQITTRVIANEMTAHFFATIEAGSRHVGLTITNDPGGFILELAKRVIKDWHDDDKESWTDKELMDLCEILVFDLMLPQLEAIIEAMAE